MKRNYIKTKTHFYTIQVAHPKIYETFSVHRKLEDQTYSVRKSRVTFHQIIYLVKK